MKLKNLLLMTFVVALLIAPAGCIFSPDNGGGGGVPVDNDLPDAITEDQLMENFEVVYTDMLIDEFEEMLHDDYQTVLLAETLDEWGWDPNYTFDKTEEVGIHRNMFGGQMGKDVHGNDVHPIDSIVVNVMERQGIWAPIPEDDLYFGGYGGKWANYEVDIQFNDADLSHRYVVQQSVNFFVVPVQIDGRTIFQLLGQRGLPLSNSD